MSVEIYTIGHSTQPGESFVALLQCHAVATVADVRSQPHSRRNPQFNRDRLAAALASAGIEYVFLGRELGARSEDPSCYVDDCVQYQRLAQTGLFKSGIERVLQEGLTRRVALMCAEKEPLDCHRTILVARELELRDARIQHIHIDGHLEPHPQAMARLMKQLKLSSDLFVEGSALLDEAYERQGRKIAYQRPAPPRLT
jgi:uncharacterized protein (DUF488 family)